MDQNYEVIIIGTGPGGSTLAHALAPTGKKILILERGQYLVRSKDNWDPKQTFHRGIYNTDEKWLTKEGAEFQPGQAYVVGGNSKFFGAAMLRMRREDFGEIVYEDGLSPAWPISYEDLEPYYTEAERLYYVHGERGEDPTEPQASKPYAYPKVSQEPRIREIFDQLKGQGLRPFPLPLAIRLNESDPARSACIRCNTCAGYPCLVNGKGDAEQSCLVHALAHANVTMLTGATAEKIETDPSGTRVRSVHVTRNGESLRFEAPVIVVAAGAINSALLLLKSANAKHPRGLGNSSGLVGRNYMRHNNSVMLAIDPTRRNPTVFQKTIGISDWYLSKNSGSGPIGLIQLTGKTTEGLLQAHQPLVPSFVLRWMAEHSVDWWFTTEDLPLKENGVALTPEGRVRLSLTPTNLKPHARLIQEFKTMLRKMGFRIMLTKSSDISGVAHQVGTCVMGRNPAHSVLDVENRTHDIENLYVVDGSFFPSSSHVNPTLTIAANALRVGELLQKKFGLAEHAKS